MLRNKDDSPYLERSKDKEHVLTMSDKAKFFHFCPKGVKL